MMVTVSGGFALLAVLAAVWWFASGQRATLATGARIPLDEEDGCVRPARAMDEEGS
jgi:hypothetical protein